MTKRGRPVLVGAGVAMAVLVVLFGLLVGAGRPDPSNPLPGKPAPGLDRSFANLAGGTTRLGDLRGQFVVLNFFASWCVPCEKEHPELVTFQQRHAAIGDATVVQVVFSDTPEAARRFFQQRGGGDWPVLVDPNGQFALDYGVRGPPETFLLDVAGNVLVNIKGAVDDAGLEQLVARAKAGRP